jgi:Ca-activated chloride channel family protein
MTIALPLLDAGEADRLAGRADPDRGLGGLTSELGPLPLRAVRVDSRIVGLVAATTVQQTFVNGLAVPVEATYVFPLPERAAVTAFTVTIGDRRIRGVLRERAQARADYDQALAEGRRAAITEEERPGTFTMRVGNLGPGEQAVVELVLAGPVAHEDREATFRFPLVVAPRYVAGVPAAVTDPGRPPVGSGAGPDTDLVPDASRVTPPLLPAGSPPTVDLRVTVTVDGGGLAVDGLRSSLHAATDGLVPAAGGPTVVELTPERLDRDLVLRWRLVPAGPDATAAGTGLVVTPDDGGDEGTFTATVVAPAGARPPTPPTGRDVVVVLDRSGSMQGWKMVSARRAAAQLVDHLDTGDRFAVLAFDHQIERPPGLGDGLVPATDRYRFAATEYLGGLQARGGTELQAPLVTGVRYLTDRDDAGPDHAHRHRVLVLVTDGQVAGEDHLLRALGEDAAAVTIHTVGIDRAVNAGLLQRLAAAGGGHCDLVESDVRLEEVLLRLRRRIDPPVLVDLVVRADGVEIDPGSVTPDLGADVADGVPLVVRGRYRGPGGTARWWCEARRGDDAFTLPMTPRVAAEPALTATWARAHLRDLEDAYAVAPDPAAAAGIVAGSLRFSTLCRFTAFVAVDEAEVVDPAGRIDVIQPVELPSGWAPAPSAPAPMGAASFGGAPPMPVAMRARSRPVPGSPKRAPDLDTLLDDELATVRALVFPMAASEAVVRSTALRDLAVAAKGAGRPAALVEALERLASAVAARDEAAVREATAVVDQARRERPRRSLRFWQ